METNSTGKKIKAARLSAAYSQEELATLSGLSLRSIQRIENDQTAARGDSLKRIANALKVEVDLFTNQEEPVLSQSATSLKDDPVISLIMVLSAFGYLIYPVLGIVFPFVIWTFFRNTTLHVREIGHQLLWFQLTWCILLLITFAYLFANKFFHANLPLPANSKSPIFFIVALYVANTFAILKVLLTWARINRVWQKRWAS